MTFIRTKRIKGHKYAYLVRNYWTKKGSRQKSKKYLGRVVEFPKVKDIDFFFYFGRNYSPRDKTVLQLVTDLLNMNLLSMVLSLAKIKKHGLMVNIMLD